MVVAVLGTPSPSSAGLISIKVQIEALFYHKERKEHKDELPIFSLFYLCDLCDLCG